MRSQATTSSPFSSDDSATPVGVDRGRLELHDPKLFINRELSWLEFNERVLEEAQDGLRPVFERLKFLTIVSSNLDEFFMVRVAGLKQQILGGVAETAADGMLPREQIVAVSRKAHSQIERQYRVWSSEIVPALETCGLHIVSPGALTTEQRAAVRTFFREKVFPALTPLAIDPGHPFPHLKNKSLNVAVLLRREGAKRRRDGEGLVAVIQVPAVLPRLVPVPNGAGPAVALLDEIIAEQAGELFPGFAVRATAAFRVTRNWDLNIDEEESEDLLSTIQEELRHRDRGAAVRLELAADAPDELAAVLVRSLSLEPDDIYRVSGPLQLTDLAALADFDARPELRAESLVPLVPPSMRTGSVLSVVSKQDLLLYHPYESFEPVVRFIAEAANDPEVLAIKQTLYRTSGDSPFVQALSRAAENGKQVTVLMELKARFDEANNIAWARRLEESGVHVVYGLIGLKTHCKVALVVRREKTGIRRYVHLGTGNYNPQTARQYADLSLFSAREELADDVSALFNMLTGYAEPPRWKRLVMAPFGLQERIVALIDQQAERARAGLPARVVAKMNSLVDPVVIRALYAASAAGVEIELMVRGICCLRPGVPGISERIRVTSVVDRFLEHARVFAFGVGVETQYFLSSADWMPRNFHRRVEVMVPIEDPLLCKRIEQEILGLALGDSVKARRLQMDGSYRRETPTSGASPVPSQEALFEAARQSGGSLPRTPVIRPIMAADGAAIA